jgi:3-methyladenine DNA glycosylase AlkD
MTMTSDLDNIRLSLESSRDEVRAVPMRAYMRDQFAFLGIPAPRRTKLVRAGLLASQALKKPIDEALVLELWGLNEREFQYAACDYLAWQRKKLQAHHLALLERLITEKSWWDSVDSLVHNVGAISLRFPESHPTLERWAQSENFWLRRAAILHQLGSKTNTDELRLFKFVLDNSQDSEFFIRKAIGWALREHSYTNPEGVRNFVLEHQNKLSTLSKREALKGLERRAAQKPKGLSDEF